MKEKSTFFDNLYKSSEQLTGQLCPATLSAHHLLHIHSEIQRKGKTTLNSALPKLLPALSLFHSWKKEKKPLHMFALHY